jgi:hypothetical protein
MYKMSVVVTSLLLLSNAHCIYAAQESQQCAQGSSDTYFMLCVASVMRHNRLCSLLVQENTSGADLIQKFVKADKLELEPGQKVELCTHDYKIKIEPGKTYSIYDLEPNLPKQSIANGTPVPMNVMAANDLKNLPFTNPNSLHTTQGIIHFLRAKIVDYKNDGELEELAKKIANITLEPSQKS